MTETQPATTGTLPRVVIVGGGFAGVNAAQALADAPVRVTLIDRRVYNTFQPLLYQVATGGLNPGDVTHFLRSLRMRQRNLEVVHEHLMEIDPDAKTVRLLDGQTLDYDFLVLANGVTTTYFGTPGAKEHAFAVYSRSQAIRIRDTLFTRLEKATQTPDRTDGLRVVVVGGGPTGVEMAGALAELRDQGLRPAYPELDGDAFRITIVQRSPELLKPFVPSLRTYAAKQLTHRNVELCFGAGVSEVHADSVTLTDGRTIPSDMTIWATGVAPHEEVRYWSLPLDEYDRIKVGADLQVEGLPGVFAAGDIAIAPQDLPQLAQPAIQGGRHVGRQIRHLLDGRPTEPFEYYDKGQLAIIGRRSAVGELPGIANLPGLHAIRFLQKVPGFRRTIALTAYPAWWVWLFVHIQSLLGARNRLTTMVGLWARYGFHYRKPVPIVGDVPAIRPSKAQRLRFTPEQQRAADEAIESDRADEVITIATPARSNRDDRTEDDRTEKDASGESRPAR
ncbi:NAD(P)/FAD-dependent oxidoreductase [Agromyces intestinalis]|uniref:NADH:ubiquinone reductase (non-electrogenic) n=1 Tax=Agromyces intestinalis TaxID=2592652 RepID=A0A5C1YHB6_9MICO|nr:NAD(P)/FAD-dependent oxidoreductase [Agromyces intestinalis]QEO14489.1 NAD(P)/FAD-dependent oxidoreductase [Agromyces intestinalis]